MVSRSASLKLEASKTSIVSGAVLNGHQRELAQRAPLFPTTRLRRGYGFEFTGTGRAQVPGFQKQTFPEGKACILTPSALRRLEAQAARALPAKPSTRRRFWHDQLGGLSSATSSPVPLPATGSLSTLATQTLSADLAPSMHPGLSIGVTGWGPPRRPIGS